MQINELEINGFGNLKNKTIKLNNGLNLVVGNNESGKSTLTAFIKGILYGINKNKNGNEYSEYELYKPWDDDALFSGTMKYTYKDNDYMLQRSFSTNNAKIYNAQNEEISALFNKTKSRGLEVGFEQLGIDEETFINSALVNQKSISIDKEGLSSTIQKLTNIIQNGDENLSYEEIKKKLEKTLYEEVGTDRTATKPKYICKKDISELENKRDSIMLNRKRQENIEKRKAELENELMVTKEEEKNASLLLEIKQKYEDEIQKEKVKFDIEKKAKEEHKIKKEAEIKKRKIIDTIIIVIASAILIGAFLYIQKYLYAGISLLVGIVLLIINLFTSYKEEVEADTDNFDLISEDVRKKQNKEIKDLEDKGIDTKYKDTRIVELKSIKEELKNRLNNLELEYHKNIIEEDSLKEGINSLNEIEEELGNKREQLKEIELKEETLNLAIDNLNKAYGELKSEIIPEIEEDIKYSVTKTTNQTYTEVKYTDVEGLVFKDINGGFQKVNKLSAGAIDQIYLGFRLAISSKYEDVPLIFDEAFVFFDDERLKNVLKTLLEISETRQVILLSCANRERELLNLIKANYNEVQL